MVNYLDINSFGKGLVNYNPSFDYLGGSTLLCRLFKSARTWNHNEFACVLNSNGLVLGVCECAKAHRFHFSWVIPHINVGVLKSFIHRNPFRCIYYQHFRQQVPCLARCITNHIQYKEKELMAFLKFLSGLTCHLKNTADYSGHFTVNTLKIIRIAK